MKTFILHTIACGFLLLHQAAKTQNILHLSCNEPFFVSAGTILSLDSLVLVPSVNAFTTAANDVVKSKRAVHPPGNDYYIQRVYRFTNPLPAFMGTITIYYHDDDADYLTENDLTLEMYNGSSWIIYNAGVTRNATANFVTTAGLSGVTLSELTLTGSIAPLFAPTVKTMVSPPATNTATAATGSNVAVYPNPATSIVNIIADKGAVLKSIKLYSQGGGLADVYTIDNSNQYTINISRFASGVYTVVIVLTDGRSITKTVVKQ